MENKINIKTVCDGAELNISAPSIKQTITATNNKAQEFAQNAQKYRDEAKIYRDNAKYYSENSNVNLEVIENLRAELLNEINLKQEKGDYAMKQDIPTNISQLDNNLEFISKVEFELEAAKMRLPNQENCEGRFLSSDGQNAVWKNISGFKLFDIKISDCVLDQENSLGWGLQGTYISKSIYPDFYAKCVEEKLSSEIIDLTLNGNTINIYENSNGHKFYDILDKSFIDNWYNEYGIAWFYGIDFENERILLPRDNFFAIKGIAPVVGNGMTIGLNNGSKNVGLSSYSYDFLTASSDAYGQPVRNSGDSDTSRTAGRFGLTLDPTKSGIETRLQPDETKYLYICVGNSFVNESLVDVGNLSSDLQFKVDIDLSNCTKPYIAETYKNGLSWYRVYSDGWCEQGGYNNGNGSIYNFLKPFKDMNYIILATSNSTNDAGGIASAYKRSNSQFALHSTNNGFDLSWYACGYI